MRTRAQLDDVLSEGYSINRGVDPSPGIVLEIISFILM